MIILLSPAKTISATSSVTAPIMTTPLFEKEASEIALHMTQYSDEELGIMLKVNPKIAREACLYYREFHGEDTVPLQAILTYTGIVYKNINPADFTDDDFMYAQEHLRIGSECYGLLRPLDGIRPYRMEYDVCLPELGEGNMYTYWRPRVTDALIGTVKKDDGILINLASMDVQSSFNLKKPDKHIRIITPEFKLWKNGKYKTIVIYAKMARGQMSRYIIKNRITDPEDLKSFSWEGFRFDDALSTDNLFLFVQDI